MDINFKLSDDSVMFDWLVDRLASGFNLDMVRSLFLQEFGTDISVDYLQSFYDKNLSRIELRNIDLKKMVYDSGVYSKLKLISDKLYDSLSSEDLSAKEVAQLSDTLRKYLETMISFSGHKIESSKSITNNFLVIESLEKEGLIKILDVSKTKYLLDGVCDG